MCKIKCGNEIILIVLYMCERRSSGGCRECKMSTKCDNKGRYGTDTVTGTVHIAKQL